MVSTYRLKEDFPAPHSAIKQLIHGSWNWKSSGAVIGLCGGLTAPIFGAVVTLVSWFIDPVWHGMFLHQAATSLFFLAIPLLVLGAHCLDLLDNEQRSEMETKVRTTLNGNCD